MKTVEIYETQKRGPAVVICRLGWDRKNKHIVPLLNADYADALFNGSYLNKVTMERVHPTHSLKFLKQLHDCFLNLSYVRASKLMKIKSTFCANREPNGGTCLRNHLVLRGGKKLFEWKVPFLKTKSLQQGR